MRIKDEQRKVWKAERRAAVWKLKHNWKKSGCKNRNSILKIDKATAMTPTNLKVNVGTVRLSLRTYVSTSDADLSDGFCLFPACLRVYEKKYTRVQSKLLGRSLSGGGAKHLLLQHSTSAGNWSNEQFKTHKSHMISLIPFVCADSRQEVSWLSSQESLPCLAEKDANCVWAQNCTGVGNVVLLKLAQRSLSSSLEQVHMSISC